MSGLVATSVMTPDWNDGGAGSIGGMNLGAPEIIGILIIVLLLFGSTKLPKLARSLGEASKEFKKGVDEGQKVDSKESTDKPTS